MFDKIKKAFGFGGIEEPDNVIADDPEMQDSEPSPFSENPPAHEAIESKDVDEVAKEIFTHVVEQFNAALPDFLKKSVEPEKQKKALLDSLTTDLKNHLAQLESNVVAQVNESWRKEREKLQSDLKNVSRTAKDIEAKRAELKARQLSDDRQKRAMTERIHELEKRNLALEAEKEQLDLENKSMVNKVKIAQVYEKDIKTLQEQIENLQSELTHKKLSASDSSATPAAGEHSAKLLNLEKSVSEAEKLNRELSKKNTELSNLNEELSKRNAELSKTEKEYRALVDKMDQVERQLAMIDKLNDKKDARIKELEEEVARKNTEIENKKNITEVIAEPNKNTSHDVELDGGLEIPDDDDILNDTDWIVQTPLKKEPKRSKSRKSTNRDDGQMSLW